jgi:hypothetical protein
MYNLVCMLLHTHIAAPKAGRACLADRYCSETETAALGRIATEITPEITPDFTPEIAPDIAPDIAPEN